MNDIYTIAKLAEKLEVSERTIADAIRDGRLKGFKQFKKWYITHQQLIEFLESNQNENKLKSKRPTLGNKK